ncbi:MAG: NYN domain-containing protein, partial [Gammaproteobacteria bacterium]|nr:NYN domain-containing protein [Gammaproteobacteria bacterium]
RYFTAKVIAREDDPTIRIRQNLYLRALRTIPELEIHFGMFKRRTVQGRLLAEGNSLHKKRVSIEKFEEKGSDVNIATFMLVDCFQKECDVPVLISNDSDLAEPLRYIKTILKIPVGLVTPATFFTAELKRYSSFQRKISDKQLESSQFPRKLRDNKGEISCPEKWL